MNKITVSGVVTSYVRNSSNKYNIELESGNEVICRTSGRLCIKGIKPMPGDKVDVDFKSVDLLNGTIIKIYK